MNVPENLKYAESHEWVQLEGDQARVGITDHAQSELTDVVYVELPTVGDKVDAGNPVAVVESVKAASDIYAPVSGTIIEVNAALESDPALVNTDAFGEGWLFVISVDAKEELNALKTADQYIEQIS
ncbi:MAG TPA: glycine cleavage system protein GcvH [Chthoniobacteraceae bacterium]|nr:glycine cleavage system protein GcvH [Chthoniobacteraceae bacterium]